MKLHPRFWKQSITIALLVPIVLAFTYISAQAEIKKPANYPTRPVEIIVTWGPGGGTDTFIRAICREAEKILGVPIAVINMPGGAGTTGMTYAVEKPADGYTLFSLGVDQVSTWVLKQHHNYTVDDWTPIMRGQLDTELILINSNDKRFQTWAEFIAYTKAHPKEKISVSCAGLMGTDSLFLQALSEQISVEFKQVPFDSHAERAAAVAGGHIDLLWERPGTGRSFVEAKQLTPLILFMDDDIDDPLYRNTINQKKAGVHLLEGSPSAAWRGIGGPKGINPEIVEYLDQVFYQAMQTASYKKLEKERYLHLRKGYLNHKDFKKFLWDEYNAQYAASKKMGWVK